MSTGPRWGGVAGAYARSRPGYPPEAFALLAAAGAGLPGQVVVDVGCGTGALTRGLAAAGAAVTGVDPDEGMLAAAAAAGDGPAYRRGTAEHTGLPPAGADAVTAAQCWHWVDRPRAAREALWLLRPGGVLAILGMDWSSSHPVLEATDDAVRRHSPGASWAPALPAPSWDGELAGAGFRDPRRTSAEVLIAYRVEAWVTRIRASAPVGASMDAAAADAVCADVRDAVAPLAVDGVLAVPHHIALLTARAERAVRTPSRPSPGAPAPPG